MKQDIKKPFCETNIPFQVFTLEPLLASLRSRIVFNNKNGRNESSIAAKIV